MTAPTWSPEPPKEPGLWLTRTKYTRSGKYEYYAMRIALDKEQDRLYWHDVLDENDWEWLEVDENYEWLSMKIPE